MISYSKRISFIIFLILIFVNNITAQLLIRKVDSLGNIIFLNSDSLLIIPEAKIDSIILNNLDFPKELDDEDFCEECMGHIFYEFEVRNNLLLKTKLLRGIDDYIDSIFLQQHQKIFETVKNSVKTDSNTLYSFIIIVKLLRDSNPDSIYIEKSTGFKSSVYVFRKNVFNISINVKNMKKGYIPKDLTDCITQLDKIMDEASKIWCRKHSEQYFSYKAHHGLGMWIRNNWKLWGSSRLSKYFNELGIYHPDDMSGIILKSYYRYLNSEEINLDEQIKYYQDFWENRE